MGHINLRFKVRIEDTMPKKLFVILIVLLVLIQGCAPSAPTTPTATPTIDPATPTAATAAAETKAAEEALAAANAQATADALSTAGAQETADAAVFGTQTAVAQATAAELSLRKTSTAAAKETQSAYAAATQGAQDSYIQGVIDTLVQDSFLTTNKGEYERLDDLTRSEAMINYYNWDMIPYFAKDFVIDTDLTWESASDKANWWNSGCGFVFRLDDSGKHYLIFLALDGNVYWYRNDGAGIYSVKQGYFGKLDNMAGSAHFTMAVEDKLVTVLIDGKKVFSSLNAVYEGLGLGYTLVSGTNKDFGTQCDWTNTYIWSVNK
jgi:hypothetical protein